MRQFHKKIWKSYFDAVATGQKTFELRLADWDCAPGDILILDEVDDATKAPTGRSIRKTVGFVAKTKTLNFFTPEDVERYGYQIISLLDETD